MFAVRYWGGLGKKKCLTQRKYFNQFMRKKIGPTPCRVKISFIAFSKNEKRKNTFALSFGFLKWGLNDVENLSNG